MYIKVGKATNLNELLDIEFVKIGSSLKTVAEPEDHSFPFSCARIESKLKFSQIYISEALKTYLPDFWKAGVCMANGSTDNMTLLVRAIDFWMSNNITAKQLADEFNFVKPTDKANAFDEGNEIEYTWNLILNDPALSGLKPFIALANKDEVLSQLFPFISLDRLCFSRCTGYPYTTDAPFVSVIGNGLFEVQLPNNKSAGKGSAEEIVAIVKRNLPINIGGAVKGTAEDLQAK